MDSIGRRLQILREKKGLSQEAAAAKLGVSSSTVSKWERDRLGFRGDSVTKLAEIYETTADWILRGDVDVPHEERTVEIEEDVRTALAEALADWDPDEWGAPPSEEELGWLKRYSFRSERESGLEVTPRLLASRLRDYRRDLRGKALARQKADMPEPRPGRVKVPRKR